MVTMVTWTLLLVLVTGTLATPLCDSPPVEECVRKAMGHPVDRGEAHEACVKQWWDDRMPNNNLTYDDRIFFNLRRQSRYGYGPPPTGFRVRKEIRRLTYEERKRLFAAIEVVYRRGILARFGRLHAAAVKSIHTGASFLPWHRVFIADFEEELRRVDPTVSLPYWDWTMDVIKARPTDSVLWTPCFFGTDRGTLTTPPFLGFYGGRKAPIQRGNPTRETKGCGPILPDKKHINDLMTKCYFREITTGRGPYRSQLSILEGMHDGPHNWVGGDMGDLELSAFDPVFYFHHAMVDYIWDQFQKHQIRDCNVKPQFDYRPDHDSASDDRDLPTGTPKMGHHFCDLMVGYEHLRNADGLWLTWTQDYYSYELQPMCPNCGSQFLVCDPMYGCKSKNKTECDEGLIRPRAAYGAMTGDFSGLMFVGEELSESRPFISNNPFNGPTGDRRTRDMSFAESSQVLLEQTGFGSFSSSTLRMTPAVIPPMTGSFGAPSVLTSSPGTGAIGFGGFGDNFLPSMPHRGGLPVNPGFIPFRRADPRFQGLPPPPRPYMEGYPMDPAQCPIIGAPGGMGQGSVGPAGMMPGFKPVHKKMKTFG